MAYNISGLPAYTDQQSREFIVKSILGVKTIALLTQFGAFDPTAKGSAAIQLLDSDVVIQDGSGCGRNPMGGATLTQDILSVKPLKVNQNYCVAELTTTWAVNELKAKMAGLPYTDALFLDDIGDINSKKVALKLEQMMWLGDTTLADTSLKQIDGFIKQIKAGTGASAPIDLNPTDQVGFGGDVASVLLNAVLAMPFVVKQEEDFRILIGQDVEELYLAQMVQKNLYVPVGSGMIYGSAKKYEALPGLNGTNIVIAARVSRLRAGGEMTAATFKKQYSIETEQTYFDSHFSLGVVPVYREEIGIGDYAPAVAP